MWLNFIFNRRFSSSNMLEFTGESKFCVNCFQHSLRMLAENVVVLLICLLGKDKLAMDPGHEKERETLSPEGSTSDAVNSTTERLSSVAVSTAFHPGAFDVISDTVLLSVDSVLFYVHSATVTRAQPFAFRRLMNLPLTDPGCRDRIIQVPETSNVLAVMLHALYDTPCNPIPSLDTLIAAIDKMRLYEISPAIQLTAQSTLYKLVLSLAPVKPMEVYALAAFHRLHHLAVDVSVHLISYPLSSLTDPIAERIGPTYLLRLFQWRLHRTAELKKIFLKSPFPHIPTRQCPFERQQAVTQIWADISVNLVYDDHIDLTLSSLHSLADPYINRLECELCKECLQNKIREVVVEWNAVPRTIPPAGDVLSQ